ncbi:MAG: ExbD/TolR family protein [Pseudomonadales bacterium]
MRRLRQRHHQDAELNITAFMNLMIVLVPVLLMTMVFSQITVLELTLPDAATSADTPEVDKHLELVVRKNELQIYYPRGFLVRRIPIKPIDESATAVSGASDNKARKKRDDYDYDMLSDVLQQVKRLIREAGEKEAEENGTEFKEKRDITILSEQDTDYQTIVSLMDASRSFKAVVAGSVVDAELFPEISLGDAPELPPEVASK